MKLGELITQYVGLVRRRDNYKNSIMTIRKNSPYVERDVARDDRPAVVLLYTELRKVEAEIENLLDRDVEEIIVPRAEVFGGDTPFHVPV